MFRIKRFSIGDTASESAWMVERLDEGPVSFESHTLKELFLVGREGATPLSEDMAISAYWAVVRMKKGLPKGVRDAFLEEINKHYGKK